MPCPDRCPQPPQPPRLTLPDEWPRPPLVHDVIAAAVTASGIPRRVLTGAQRRHALVAWRQAAMEVAAQATGYSLTVIGRVFGRNHTTVIHARRSVAWAVQINCAETLRQLDAICSALVERMQQPAVAAAAPAHEPPPVTVVVTAPEPEPPPGARPAPRLKPLRPLVPHPLSVEGAAVDRWFAENDARFRHAMRTHHPEIAERITSR